MKLRRLIETDIHRRQFLKRAGTGLLGLLLNKGVPANFLKPFVHPAAAGPAVDRAVLSLHGAASYSGPTELFALAQNLVGNLRSLLPQARPRALDGEESLWFGVLMRGQSILELLARPDVQVLDQDDDGHHLYLKIGQEEYHLSRDQDDLMQFNGAPAIRDPIRTAWDVLGRWSSPEDYVNMKWLGDIDKLLQVAKQKRLPPPSGLPSWEQFKPALKQAVMDWRREQDTSRRQWGQHGQEEDPETAGLAGPAREYYRQEVGGMHQSFEQKLHSALNRTYLPEEHHIPSAQRRGIGPQAPGTPGGGSSSSRALATPPARRADTRPRDDTVRRHAPGGGTVGLGPY